VGQTANNAHLAFRREQKQKKDVTSCAGNVPQAIPQMGMVKKSAKYAQLANIRILEVKPPAKIVKPALRAVTPLRSLVRLVSFLLPAGLRKYVNLVPMDLYRGFHQKHVIVVHPGGYRSQQVGAKNARTVEATHGRRLSPHS